MPYAANGQISQSPIVGGIEITEAQYGEGLAGVLAGKMVRIDGGFAVVPPTDLQGPVGTTPDTLGAALALKFAQLDAQRRVVEEGGIMFGTVPLKTDRQTAAIITAAYVKAKENPAFMIANWKFADGVFAPLDAATIIAAGDAIAGHVQSAFDREAALSAELLSLDTIEAVLAFDVEARWGDPN